MSVRITFDKDIFVPVYMPAYKCKKRYLLFYGGAGSGKSTFVAQKLLIRLIKEPSHRFLILRKYLVTVRKSQFQLLTDLISQWNLNPFFEIKKSELEIIFKPNKNKIITAGLDNPEKLKSIQGISGIWIEEATELTKNDFLQCDLRLRGKTRFYKQIILSFNPVDLNHWIYDRFFINKTGDSEIIMTTYKDNKFLDNQYISILESLALHDKNFNKIYTRGEWGSLSNLIYPDIPDCKEPPTLFDNIYYGLDFGFNNPAALIKIAEKDKIYYLTQLLYETGLTSVELISRMKNLIENPDSEIYADPEDSGMIESIRQSGFNIIKGKKEVKTGIDLIKNLIFSGRLFLLGYNPDLRKELISYKYKKNSSGILLEEPVKQTDHLMDAMRYGLFTHLTEFSGSPEVFIIHKRRRK